MKKVVFIKSFTGLFKIEIRRATVLRTFIALIMLFASPAVWAWNFTGHVVIAQIAYDNLTPQAKNETQQLAADIYKQLPDAQQEKLKNRYPNASIFAMVASLPDTWRLWKLKTLARKFNAVVPLDFSKDASRNTAAWHYINIAYPANTGCQTIKPINIIQVIPQLENVITTTNNTNTRALMMVFLEHLVGDAHQPLHIISGVNTHCLTDKGGNDVCLKRSARDHCTLNLHQLWDRGLGVFRYRVANIQQAALDIQHRFPVQALESQIKNVNPNAWTQREYSLAPFIYNITDGEKPSPTYYKKGQTIVRHEVALAGYQLAEMINALLS